MMGAVQEFFSEEFLSKSDFIIKFDEKRSLGGKTIFRANLKDKDDVHSWLALYQKSSNTRWNVLEEVKSLTRVVYHKYWTCHLSPKNKKEGTLRNKHCTASLDILIKKVNRDTIKNDAEFLGHSPPLAAVITFKGKHAHPTHDNGQVLGLLRISEETKSTYFNYFNEGTGPGEALRLHEAKILMEDDGPIHLANASINPSRRTVYYTYDLWRESEYGKNWNTDPLAKLREKVSVYESEGTSLHFDDEDPSNWAVLVVTPIMKRAQTHPSAAEVIFIDSTSSVEYSQSTLTVILTATKGGAIPIGIVIHNSQSIDGYEKAFSLLKKFYPKCFGNNSEPQAFMTDHSDAEKAALKRVWEAVRQFLCGFHVGQSEWRWLLKAEHKVEKKLRQHLISILKKLMYASHTEEFENAKAELLSCGHDGYIEHVEKELLSIQEEWVQMFRSEVLNRGHRTNNYAEASIRVLKEIVLSRTKAFNVAAMADFIAHVWEIYFTTRLLHYAYNREAGPHLRYKKLSQRMPAEAAEKIKKEEDDIFLVPSGNPKTPDLEYEVQASIGWCSCPIGEHGAFCKHQALVHKKFGGLFPNMPAIDAKSRYDLGKLALGERCPQPKFFLSIDEANEEVNIDGEAPIAIAHEEHNISNEENPTAHEETKTVNCSDAKLQLMEELQRTIDLGEKTSSPTFHSTILRLTQKLKNVQNPNQALTTLISLLARAGSSTRRGSRINVQPTAPSRRRMGVTRGCKKISSGRPSSQLQSKIRKKRPHSLAMSIQQNKSHPKSDGH